MFLTYEDSVLEAADENGNLTYNQVVRLLADHDVEIEELYAYPQDIDPVADEYNAEAILAWLGY